MDKLGLVFEWLIFFGILAFGVYTMKVIKQEKQNYLDNAQKIIFQKQPFCFDIPRYIQGIQLSDYQYIPVRYIF